MGKPKKKLFIKSYGCQMNVYDAQRMEDLLKEHDYDEADDWKEADVAILNTCHIREGASEKVYSHLGLLRKIKHTRHLEGKDFLIGVVGCVAQAQGEAMLARAPFVDFILGPQAYQNLPETLATLETQPLRKREKILCLDFAAEDKFSSQAKLLPHGLIKNRLPTAFVTIQEGCDKFCTFCVVPYTRGAEISRSVADIEHEVHLLVDSGVREITLLGQNVNAYHGLNEKGETCDLAQLILRLERIESLERIFYTTSHPIDMTDSLIDVHGFVKKLMPCLHLPVQSGSDTILKKMNRRHTIDQYLEIIEKLRQARPDIALSSDFIVAFPGETEKDFEQTLALIKKVTFARAYSFKYSPRPGTPASLKDDQIDPEIASQRLYRLQEILFEQQRAFNEQCVHTITTILCERLDKKGDIVGKTCYAQPVYIKNGERIPEIVGSFKDVYIYEAGLNALQGKFVEQNACNAA